MQTMRSPLVQHQTVHGAFQLPRAQPQLIYVLHGSAKEYASPLLMTGILLFGRYQYHFERRLPVLPLQSLVQFGLMLSRIDHHLDYLNCSQMRSHCLWCRSLLLPIILIANWILYQSPMGNLFADKSLQ